jgi:hypothetical protein
MMESIDILDIPVVKFDGHIRAEGMVIVDTPTRGFVLTRAERSREACYVGDICMFTTRPAGEYGGHCALMEDGELKVCSSKFYSPHIDD